MDPEIKTFLTTMDTMVYCAKYMVTHWPKQLNDLDVGYPFPMSFDEIVNQLEEWNQRCNEALGEL